VESGRGLDGSVEASGEHAFDRASDVAVGLALGGASGLVGACFGVASHAGDGDCVQGSVQRAITAAVEAVAGALPAADFQWGDPG